MIVPKFARGTDFHLGGLQNPPQVSISKNKSLFSEKIRTFPKFWKTRISSSVLSPSLPDSANQSVSPICFGYVHILS